MLGTIDYVTILIYAVVVIIIGLYFYKKIAGVEDFYLAGRKLPLSLAVGTLMATWYGSSGTVATAEYAFVFGVSCWVVWCIPAHLSRIPMAIWVGPRVRLTDGITVPDMLEKLYDKRVALIAAVFLLFYCTSVQEVTALKVIGESAFNFLDPMLFACICVAIIAIYTMLGGLLSAAATDMLQMVFMVVGLTIALPFAWVDTGGWANIVNGLTTLNEVHILEPLGGMPVTKMFTLVILGLCAYSDPAFYQRFSASDTTSTARRCLLICLSLWITFDAVLSIMGIIAKVQYPDMTPGVAYLKLSLTYLPPVMKGLFVAGILGAIMSTLDSLYLIAGATLARDLYARATNQKITDRQMVNLMRVGIVVISVIGVLLASQFALVADAWIFISGLWGAAGVVPIVGGLFWPYKRTVAGGMASMLVGGGTVAIWTLLGSPYGIDGVLIGLPLSFIAFLIGNQFGRNLTVKREDGIVNV